MALIAAIAAAQLPTWWLGIAGLRFVQTDRLDARAIAARRNVRRGILVTRDPLGALSAQDPFADGPSRLFVLDDFAGELELRRWRPDLRMYYVLPRGDVGMPLLPPPPPGFSAELEWAWPAFQRPWSLGAHEALSIACCGANASGNHVLHIFESRPGARLDVPIDVASAGTYRVRVEALVGPTFGRYALTLDGHALPTYEGYAPQPSHPAADASEPIRLGRGRHSFRAECLGRAPESQGYGAAFDAIVGTPAP